MFGVTVHASHAWSWYEVAQGCDRDGPLAGVPYDGRLTKGDGKGQWWEGYDPQDLYAQNHTPGEKMVWNWDVEQGSSIPDDAYCRKFFNRNIDLIDSYCPDLLYFDDHVLPLAFRPEIGLSLAAHFYNSSVKWHGQNEAVMNTKLLEGDQRKALVWDIERGKTKDIEPLPWQTDTCIGSWHYSRRIAEQHRYKTAAVVIPMLVDIVSKNGNLLLNIPIRGNGTIDEDEIAFLEEMGDWMLVNGEAIYGTRPWRRFGEGPSAEEKPELNERGEVVDARKRAFTAEDIRFTTKGDTLYAIVLAWPEDRKLLIKSLPAKSERVSEVDLLGDDSDLQWRQTTAGLEVVLPVEKPCDHAFSLKIIK